MIDVIAPEPAPLTTPAAAEIFTAILTRGPISRVDVARLLGLSAAAVTKAVKPLLEAGYLAEMSDERLEPALGRKANPLRVVAAKRYFLGVKVTEDELIGVLVDISAAVRATHHIALAAHGPDDVVAAVVAAEAALLAQVPAARGSVAGLGISVSGDVDTTAGHVRHSPLLGWQDVPLAKLVEAVVAASVTVDNDVRALTLSERWFGGGVGADNFALVTIGAGIGCGIYLDGEVLSGAFGVAGEIGHLPLVHNGPRCTCGRKGCVETVASSSAILREARRITGRPELTMADAVDHAHHGDRAVGRVFDKAGQVIGLALATVVNIVGPERVVISGEGVADYDLYDRRIREAFGAHAFGAAGDCEIIIRPLSFDEWARGAAAVAIRAFITPLSRLDTE